MRIFSCSGRSIAFLSFGRSGGKDIDFIEIFGVEELALGFGRWGGSFRC